MPRWYQYILPKILAVFTRHTRECVEIHWSSKSWTHNLFRLWELIFWRRQGIRAEMSAGWVNGKWIQQAHSFEAACALVETAIRDFVKIPKFRVLKVYFPQFASTAGYGMPSGSPYLLAIAFDANSVEVTSASFTVTGSSMILISSARSLNGDDLTSITYNGVSLTLGIKEVWSINNRTHYLYYMKGPATGSNTFAVTGVSTAARVASYSGAAQTGGVDSAKKAFNTTGESGDITFTINVTTTNSWIVESFLSADINPTAMLVCTTARDTFVEASQLNDTNTGVSSGNNSPGYTWSASDRHDLLGVAFAPTGGAVVVRPTLLTLGVG